MDLKRIIPIVSKWKECQWDFERFIVKEISLEKFKVALISKDDELIENSNK